MAAGSSQSSLPVQIHCYGKLPFHPEYLRMGLATGEVQRVVRWIDEAHAALTAVRRRDAAGGVDYDALLASIHRFALPVDDGKSYATGLVARSSDGLREHPICLFSIVDVGAADWWLLPQAFEHVWSRLEEILRGRPGSRDQLSEQMAASVEVPLLDELDGVAREDLDRQRDGGAWHSLTGLEGEAAWHAAMNLMAICAAQLEARTAEEGVALSVPVPGDLLAPGSLAAWLGLLASLAGPTTAPPLRPAIAFGGENRRLFVFLRPIDGRDLATILTGTELSAIDDLADRWQRVPDEGSPRYDGIASLVADSTVTYTQLFVLARSSLDSWRAA